MRILLFVASVLLLAFRVPLLATEPVKLRVEARIVEALENSVPYLEKDGRAWFEGENIYQEKGCVSCHQVPSGVWSLAHCYISLDSKSRELGDELLHDAVAFVSDPEIGRPATWAQILIAAKLREQGDASEGGLFDQAKKSFIPEILKAQQEDGRWKAQGQFPSQKRPIKESDAVVTMWMLVALEGAGDPQVNDSVAKAQKYLNAFKGKSNEWLAWRSITAKSDADRRRFLGRLRKNQHQDGSFGWSGKQPGNVYSTGVALFALTSSRYASSNDADSKEIWKARNAAVNYLLEKQQEEGYWLQSSKPITNKASESHDYIYQYWSTAWASLGLSQAMVTADR